MTDTSGDTPVAVAAEAAVLAPATTETGGGHAPLSSSAGNSGGVNNGGSWSRAELRRLKDGLTEELTGERASQLQKGNPKPSSSEELTSLFPFLSCGGVN